MYVNTYYMNFYIILNNVLVYFVLRCLHLSIWFCPFFFFVRSPVRAIPRFSLFFIFFSMLDVFLYVCTKAVRTLLHIFLFYFLFFLPFFPPGLHIFIVCMYIYSMHVFIYIFCFFAFVFSLYVFTHPVG